MRTTIRSSTAMLPPTSVDVTVELDATTARQGTGTPAN
jgi:hypothetical protein